MIIDCDTCSMDGTSACDDCVVGGLLSGRFGPLRLDDSEHEALQNLAEAGLVAPLRLVPVEGRHRRPRRDAAG